MLTLVAACTALVRSIPRVLEEIAGQVSCAARTDVHK